MQKHEVWVARDEDEPKQLRMYMNKPESESGVWNDESGEYINLGDILPEVTFEESPKRLGIVDYERERWHDMRDELPTAEEKGKHFLLYLPNNQAHDRIKVGSWSAFIKFFYVSELNGMGYYENDCYWKRIELPDYYLDDNYEPDRLRKEKGLKRLKRKWQ
jgi:hypothetical protein